MTDGEMFFKKMELSDLQCNPFDMIGKSWYVACHAKRKKLTRKTKKTLLNTTFKSVFYCL